LSVLPARRDLAEVEQALVGRAGREFFLRDALEPVAGEFDTIVIDTPPNLGQLTINALVLADVVLAPVSMEDEGAAQGLVELRARLQDLARVRKLANMPEVPAYLCSRILSSPKSCSCWCWSGVRAGAHAYLGPRLGLATGGRRHDGDGVPAGGKLRCGRSVFGGRPHGRGWQQDAGSWPRCIG